MLNRRSLCGLAAAGVLTACSRHSNTSTTSGEPDSTHGLNTTLGDIDLSYAADASQVDWPAVTTAAAQRVGKLWGRTSTRLRVRIAADDAEFLASANGLTDVTGGVTTQAGAVVISSLASGSLTRAGQEVLLAHELTHARLGQYGKNPTGLWLKEGVAEWTAYHGVKLSPAQRWPDLAALDAASRPSGPPSETAFGNNTVLAYQQASAYIEYLAATAGVQFVKRMTLAKMSDAQAQLEAKHQRALSRTPFTQWLRDKFGH